MSINIKKLKPRIFLFKFFHKEDINWVPKGSLWSFDNAMMVMTEVPIGREPLMFHCGMLICGCKFLSFHLILCQRLLESNWVFFFGEFLEYDNKNKIPVYGENLFVSESDWMSENLLSIKRKWRRRMGRRWWSRVSMNVWVSSIFLWNVNTYRSLWKKISLQHRWRS